MTALAGARTSGSIRFIDRDFRPLAANAKVYPGAFVGAWLTTGAAGYYAQVQPGVVGVGKATGLGGASGQGGNFATGVSGLTGGVVDNTGGANGALSVEVEYLNPFYVMLFNNDTGTPVTVAMRGAPCYGLDDQTVTGTTNSGANKVAGLVYDVTSEGVWVKVAATDGAI